MIAFPRIIVPVPDGIALRAVCLFPARVQAAIGQAADAGRALQLCRGTRYEEGRQIAQTQLRAANKILAAHDPRLVHGWADLDRRT